MTVLFLKYSKGIWSTFTTLLFFKPSPYPHTVTLYSATVSLNVGVFEQWTTSVLADRLRGEHTSEWNGHPDCDWNPPLLQDGENYSH